MSENVLSNKISPFNQNKVANLMEPQSISVCQSHMKSEHDMNTDSFTDKEWEANMELALLHAVARCKPVGIHKHFRIMSVQREFNQCSPYHCSVKEIWERLGNYYGMSALDELEEEDDEEEEEVREEQEKLGKDGSHEFSLPLEDFEQLIAEHRLDDQGSADEESPAPTPTKRTRIGRRDTSPTASATESAASTPEAEEGKSSRRSSRGTRKSDTTQESSTGGRQAANRRSSKSQSGSRSSRQRHTKRK